MRIWLNSDAQIALILSLHFARSQPKETAFERLQIRAAILYSLRSTNGNTPADEFITQLEEVNDFMIRCYNYIRNKYSKDPMAQMKQVKEITRILGLIEDQWDTVFLDEEVEDSVKEKVRMMKRMKNL